MLERAGLDARRRGANAVAATAFERAAQLSGAADARGRRLIEAARDAHASTVEAGWRFNPFRLRTLVVHGALAGSRIEVRCQGAGCPRRGRVTPVEQSSRTISVIGRLRGAPLKRGTTIEVRISKEGFDGVKRRYTVTAPARDPRKRDFCLPASGGAPTRC